MKIGKLSLFVAFGLLGALAAQRNGAHLPRPHAFEATTSEDTRRGAAGVRTASTVRPRTVHERDACPGGTLAIVDQQHILGEDLCPRVKHLVGTGASPERIGAQTKLMVEAAVVAYGVRKRLAEHGESISDAALAQREKEVAAKHVMGDRGEVLGALREQLELERLVEIEGELEVSEAAVRAEYDLNPKRFGTSRVATLELVLARDSRGFSSSTGKAAIAQVGEALQRGLPLSEVIRGQKLEHRAGVLARHNDLEPALFAAATSTKARQWSTPVLTSAGWCIIRTIALSAGSIPSFEEVRADALELARHRRRASERTRIREELLANADMVLARR